MATNDRLSGFIIAQDVIRNTSVWKLRVNKKNHPLHRKKFQVASIRDNKELAQGLEVSFDLGNFREFGQTITKAVDVTIHNPT